LNVASQNGEEIDTPALLVDLDVMERNLKLMADFFKSAKARLRAHTKVHRCPLIAHRQIESGAKGICCQKVGEAEVMAESGIKDIIVTNEIVTPSKIQRLLVLTEINTITLPVDNRSNAELLSALALRRGTRLNVLIDIHMGPQRCGVEPGKPALKLRKPSRSWRLLLYAPKDGNDRQPILHQNRYLQRVYKNWKVDREDTSQCEHSIQS